MPTVGSTKAFVWEDSGASFMARVVGNDAANITQASITGITCKVFDSSGTSVATPSITVANVVFDTLQTDARWTVDGTGYNFLHAMPDTVFTTGGETYTVEYMFDPASGSDFPCVYEVPARALLGS